MAEKQSFILYHTQYEPIKSLKHEEKGMLLDAIFEYSTTGEVKEKLPDLVFMAFCFIRQQLDIDKEKYKTACLKNSENAQKRWFNTKESEETKGFEEEIAATKEEEKTKVCDRMRPHTNGCEPMRSDAKHADNDNDNDNDKDKDIKKKKKIKEKNTLPEVVVKKYFEDEELNQTFLEYIAYRKKIKSSLTDYAIELAIKKIKKLASTPREQQDLIEQAIVNGWKGIFPINKNSSQNIRGNDDANRTGATSQPNQTRNQIESRSIGVEVKNPFLPKV